MGREDQIIRERKKKVEELKKKGINPYPASFDQEHPVGECLNKKIGSKVKTAGRMMTKREFGKINFADLRDFSGDIQLVFQEGKGKTPEEHLKFFSEYLDAGDIIGVEGKIFKTKTGEKSILVENVKILTKSLLPLPSKWHGLQDKEERYRKRYLDLLMNPEIKKTFDIRRKVFKYIREYMEKNDFLEVETPILQPIYGGTNARPFETKLNALDMKVYLRISNELYLKRLVVGGYEKIFEFSPDFRNEGIDRTHNPEFTQVETMWAYADYEKNMNFAEGLVEYVVKKIHGKTKIKIDGKDIDFKVPWKRVKFLDAIKEITNADFSQITTMKEAKKVAKDLSVDISKCDTIGEVMIEIFEELVQPTLIQPTLVRDYPIEAAGLAKVNEKKEYFVESFELMVNGMELGLSYSEQNNPKILNDYWEFSKKKFAKGDLEAQPIDKDFLNALSVGMPPTSGLGMGIDRLTMLITDNSSIRDVIMFPFMKPEK